MCGSLFLVIFASIHLTQASTTCSDAYSCESSGKISPSECSGYYSCAHSTLIETNNAKCSGSFSCYGVSRINMTTNSFDLTCSGLYSCANVDSIGHYSEESSGSFNCDGELSCFGSIFESLKGSTLSCNGDRSCLNSNVTLNQSAVTAYGYLSAANSTFKIGDSKSDISFFGMESGKNTTVICSGTNTNCTIYCLNNACDELQLIYDNNHCDKCQFVIACDYAFKSDVCPDGIDFETELIDALSSMYGDVDDWYNQSVFNNFSMPIIPSLYENIASECTNFDNSVESCEIASNMSSIAKEMVNNSVYYVIDTGLSNEYPINCMDTFECEQDILKTNEFVDDSISSISVPICCTAENACFSSSNLKNEISESDISSIGIRCDGAVSCEAGSSNSTYMKSNGNIYVSGSSNLNDFMLIDGKDGDSNELFCNGADTCQVLSTNTSRERTIKNFENVFCNGYNSCKGDYSSNLVFENIGNSVFFYSGTGGGQSMQFNNIGNSVYCVGGSLGGCSFSVIKSVMGSVYGIGHGFDGNGIKYSLINYVKNVYGIGDYSMQYNAISNIKNNVYFIGKAAGVHSTIQNAQNVTLILLLSFFYVFFKVIRVQGCKSCFYMFSCLFLL